MQIPTLSKPGEKLDLPANIIHQIKQLNPKSRNRLTFFGGHPVSMTKQSYNAICNDVIQNYSPYLVCQKTDGVRYLLIITRQKNYMISRQGSKNICSYNVNCKIAKNWAKNVSNDGFKNIVEILDGELIEDTQVKEKSIIRFLIFDVLVHLGTQVTGCSLKHRLDCGLKFMRCNDFLLRQEVQENFGYKIDVKVKDFFRLSTSKFNTIEFILKKYIKCLPHENDGIIFNHQEKQYLFGQNQGYIKWKPPHLNTLDFLIVPNQNLTYKFGRKVVDLYLGSTNQDTGTYTLLFYNFSVVPEQIFDEISVLTDKKYDEQSNKHTQGTDYFVGVIAECRYDDTNNQQKEIFKQLLDIHLSPELIRDYIMKKTYDDIELGMIKQLQRSVYIKCWKVYKIRNDKPLPNNITIAKRIQKSIEDNINEDELIKLNKQVLNKNLSGIIR